MSFGKTLQELRIKAGKPLRAFYAELGLDPVRMSKIERGLAPPPEDPGTLERIGIALNLEAGTAPLEAFIAGGIEGSKNFVPRKLTDDELRGKVPAVYRSLRVGEDPQDVIDRSWDIAREAHRPEE